MPGKAAEVLVTDSLLTILRQIVRQSTVSRRLAQRAQVILLAWEGLTNLDIAAEVNLHRRQVGLWRARWQESMPALQSIAQAGKALSELRRAVEDVLSDAPRPGSPGTFTPQQVIAIISLACEEPKLSGRPITHWTGSELADEAQQRKIVKSISTSQVNRFLREAKLQPHRSRYWITTTEKDQAVFEAQVDIVCQTYLSAPKLAATEGTHTVCVDEMTSIQALERIQITIPMKPGQPERIEFEYQRHGTTCLICNWDVVEGQVISPTLGPTRTEVDFCWHIHDTVNTDPNAKWVFVVDNLNTHISEALVRYVAMLEGIPRSELGRKGHSGILQSMATRREFLSQARHRIRFVYLPKHSSWLNQIESIFGIINRKALRRASFTSVAELQTRILDFIDYLNRTMAKPFNWTYTGRPLASKSDDRPRTWKEKWTARRNLLKTQVSSQL